MQIRLLGDLEAHDDHHAVALGGIKQRAVLAMLGLEANRVVSADRLIGGLWGDQAPASASKMVQNYVWRLRTAFCDEAGARILTRGSGYVLEIDPDGVDVRRFEALLAAATRAAASGRPEPAAREALALWRGPALADVANEPFAADEIRRLEALRVQAAELAIDADLAAGRHHEVVSEVESLVAYHPLREHLHAQRMLSLYRCGRQAEALEAYRHARHTLVTEVGLEPGVELRGLQEAMLRQDPSLDVEPAGALARQLDAHGAPALVGRSRELAWLREAWTEARAGHGRLIAVVGEPGMGKTRLASELATEVHAAGSPVLYAAAGAAEAAMRRAVDAGRPTLLIADDVDAAAAAGLVEPARGLSACSVLAVVTARGADDLAALAVEPLLLEPLGDDAVMQIARGYAASGAPDIPVAELRASSRGLPGRLHGLASEWALEAATSRLLAVAPLTAASRRELWKAEAELAGDVEHVQLARRRAQQAAQDHEAVICPFKGLAPFGSADVGFFFGRERLVAELAARAMGAPLLGVVGPSGSGKSSAIGAGLLPALADGVLPGSAEWRQTVIRPGEHPVRELRDAGFDPRGCDGVVLAVDQFEELFTTCRDEGERARFVDILVEAAGELERGSGLVVLGVRADFYGRCATYAELARLLGANNVLVGAMRRDELRRAIKAPAQRAGLSVEPALVDALVADVAEQPGGLPLLSTALVELWQRRDGRHLRHATYAQTGGVRGAVARLAEEAYGRLTPPQHEIAHRLLLRLAGEGAGGAVVRRRVALSELTGAGEDVTAVLTALTERRLLTVSTTTAEVAHEALLREWPRLRRWLAEDAEGRRVHRHLADSAREWDERGRDPGEVYRGARLAIAREWCAAHERDLNANEREFLVASQAAGERAQRRLRMVLALVASALVLALSAALVAVHQRSSARAEARLADAQRLGTQALTEPGLARSLLLARQGVALDDSVATRSSLLSALLQHPAAIGVVAGPGGPLTAVGVSADGRTLAIGSGGGTLEFIDSATRRRIGARYRLGNAIAGVRFSADGTRLAVTGYDGFGGFVALFEGRRGRPTHYVMAAQTLPIGQFGQIAFTPDSRRLAVEAIYGDRSSPGLPILERGDELLRFNARTGAGIGAAESIGATRVPGLVGYLAGGTRLVSSSPGRGGTVIRDAATLGPLRTLPEGDRVAAASPDDRDVALGGADGSVRLLSLVSGAVRALGRHEGAVTSMAFTPDSRKLVSGGRDGRVMVWDLAGAHTTETFAGHAGPVEAVAVSPDGRVGYSAGRDGTVVGWDLTGTRRIARPFDTVASGPPAVTPDGTRFAVPTRHGTVEVIDSRTRARIRIPMPGGATPQLVAIAADGRTLAVITGRDDSARIGTWDLRTGVPIAPPSRALADGPWAPTFSHDGRLLAYPGSDTVVHVWDMRRRATRYIFDAGAPTNPTIGDAALSPSGTQLAMAIEDPNGTGALEVRSVPGFRRLARIPMPAGHLSRFSPDGRTLLYGDDQGRVWRFDTRDWRPRGRPLAAQPSAISDVDLSPDGRTLATAASDGTARLFDLRSGRPLGPPLPGVAGEPLTAKFVQSGTHLLTLSQDGRGDIWDLRAATWEQRACRIAGRTLTPREWTNALPGYPYRPACARG